MNTDRQPVPQAPLMQADITDKVLAAAFKVLNTLGAGFLEKVYENALCLELARSGCKVECQKVFSVKYDNVVVGEYKADIVVDDRVIIECKATTNTDPVHEAQLINYLRASGVRVGLLINFGRPKLQFRRLVV